MSPTVLTSSLTTLYFTFSFLPAGQLIGPVVQPVRNAQKLHNLAALLICLPVPHAAYEQGHDDIFFCRQNRQKIILLKNKTNAPSTKRRQFLITKTVNIPAIIGFISLMGISTRNGMLLMTRYNHLKAEGLPLARRIAEGSSDRLLPIVMTALTSALALIPLAINGDAPGNEIQAPMAIVILGGLLSSTLLNIYVVPALYQLLNRKEQR